MPQAKIYHVHVIEGSTIRKYADMGQYVEDFVADVGDSRMSGTAEEILSAFQCNLAGALTLDELREELDSGTNCIVIDHSVQQQTGQIIVHFVSEPEVTGQMVAGTGTLQ